MTYSVLIFVHLLSAVLIGGGLIGVFVSDLRSRQIRELPQFSEAVRNIAVFYDGVVVPGALLLLSSGTWLIVEFFGGWEFLQIPWLVGMVALFAFEFIEGNSVTRLYFMKLRRITGEALKAGHITPELEKARSRNGAHLYPFFRSPHTHGDYFSGSHETKHLDPFYCGNLFRDFHCYHTDIGASPDVSLGRFCKIRSEIIFPWCMRRMLLMKPLFPSFLACFFLTGIGHTFAGIADVVDARAVCHQDSTCDFTVTVLHEDSGWEHYANQWEIRSLDGEELGVRVLHHPHV